MKIILDIKFKPEAIDKIREEAEGMGGIEVAKKQLSEDLLQIGDEGTPDEIASISITIEAPELSDGTTEAKSPVLCLTRNPSNETWLHVLPSNGCKAAINLGIRPPDSIVDRALVSAIAELEGGAA